MWKSWSILLCPILFHGVLIYRTPAFFALPAQTAVFNFVQLTKLQLLFILQVCAGLQGELRAAVVQGQRASSLGRPRGPCCVCLHHSQPTPEPHGRQAVSWILRGRLWSTGTPRVFATAILLSLLFGWCTKFFLAEHKWTACPVLSNTWLKLEMICLMFQKRLSEFQQVLQLHHFEDVQQYILKRDINNLNIHCFSCSTWDWQSV